MSINNQTRDHLELSANLLAHCFVLGFTVLMVWLAIYIVGGSSIFDIHSKWFNLTFERFGFIMYCGMATLKMILFFFFGIPWLAIRLILIECI